MHTVQLSCVKTEVGEKSWCSADCCRWVSNLKYKSTIEGLFFPFCSKKICKNVRICFTQIWTGDWRLLQNALHVLTHYLDGLSQRMSRSMSESLRSLSFCAVYGTSLISSEKDLKYNNGLLKIDFFCLFLQEEFKVARFMDFIWCVIYITPN